jgi:hypothetical protein
VRGGGWAYAGDVTDPQWRHIRVGDSDREHAIAALGEHMSLGRLSVDEYDGRAGDITAAKTRGELLEQFADLPEPRPRFDVKPDTSGATAPRLSKESSARQDQAAPWHREERRSGWHAAAVILPLAMLLVAVVVGIFDRHGLFLIIPALFMFGGWAHRAHPSADRQGHDDPRMRH